VSENYKNKQPALYQYQDSSQQKCVLAGGRATTQDLRNWFVLKVAELTGIEPREISVGKPFTVFGVTSKDAVIISGELEEWLGRRLSPTLLYDYPTIEAIVRHLATQSEVADPGQQSNAGSMPKMNPLGEILAQLEPLTECEAETLLEKQALTKKLRGKEPR
jgi:acyl carrier protein